MKTHKCPIPECTIQIMPHQAFCREHWFNVPKSLQLEIWAAQKSAQDERWKECMAKAMNALMKVAA